MRDRRAVARGTEWRYYACPVRDKRTFRHDAEGNLVECDAAGVPGGPVEQFVTEAISALQPPPEVWEAAEEEVRQANGRPSTSGSDKERARLAHRLEALRKQHEWGDITDEEYPRRGRDTGPLVRNAGRGRQGVCSAADAPGRGVL